MIVVMTTLFLVYWKLQPMGGQNHMSMVNQCKLLHILTKPIRTSTTYDANM